MPVPSTLADLDPVAANNSPPGSEAVGTNIDNYLRAGFAFIAQLDDNKLETTTAASTYQPLDSLLTSLAGQTTAANKVQAYSASDTALLLDFKDEDDMASDSATAIPSQQSVKAYVLAQAIPQTVISYTGTGGITSKGAVLSKAPGTVIPRDDTIPQNTEGDAILDVTIIPSVAGAVIDVEFNIAVENEAGGGEAMIFAAALFRDTTANAEYVVARSLVSGHASGVSGKHRITAPDTTAITFKLRGGPATTQNLSYNSGSAATYGAVMNSYISATEVSYT